MQENTIGSAQHKIKTINVEVNLLDAWVDQRVELEGKFLRKMILLGVILVSSCVMIPVLSSKGSEVADNLHKTDYLLRSSTQQRTALEKKAKAYLPGIEFDDMVNRTGKLSNAYLNELTRVVNSAPTRLFFDGLQSEVTNGECSIKVQANAASSEVGRDFVDRASKGKNVSLSKQVSSKQSTLSSTSVKFDYLKKVEFAK